MSQSFKAPTGVGEIVVGGLNLTGNTHTLQLVQQSNSWTFASEIQFFNLAVVPKPATWAMLVLGFGIAGAAMHCGRGFAIA